MSYFCSLLLAFTLFLVPLSTTTEAHIGRSELSDETHYSETGAHNVKFDHEAFLGKELADKLQSESFDSNKKQLVEIFTKIDSDHNGTISEPEMYAWVKKISEVSLEKEAKRRWNDINPDKIDPLPFETYLEKAFGPEDRMPKEGQYWADYQKYKNDDSRRWKSADQDQDGKLSFQEFKAFVNPTSYPHMKDVVIDEHLDRADSNKDGSIQLEEYLAEIAKNTNRDFDPSQPKPDWALKEAEDFDRWRDKNHDGKMDRDDIAQMYMPSDYDPYDAETKHLFYHADKNSDKQLNVEEMLASQSIFVGSSATNYGKAVHDQEEL